MKLPNLLIKYALIFTFVAGVYALAAPSLSAAENGSSFPVMTGKLVLEQDAGPVRSEVHFQASGLAPGKPVKAVWMDVEGSYKLDGIYTFVQPEYTQKQLIVVQGTTDANGNWEGTFHVPVDFGGDHTVYIRQNNQFVAQSNFFVETTFSMSPASGPIGTEITIEAEGIGWTSMESNWQVSYDNKLTGLISAVSTNGTAKATFRAAGPVGKHSITVWHGYLGIPYLNHQQAPNSYLPVPTYSFEVTNEKPELKNVVEQAPASAANGGVVLPDAKFKKGVTAKLNKESGIVGEDVVLAAAGLPAGQDISLVWNTMVGSRVSGKGFEEKQVTLGTVTTDSGGKLNYSFKVPDDLGGIPHRLDLAVGNDVYGQVYLRIDPSIASMTPVSGPNGTEVTLEVKGVGWTEFDNAYYVTYDNNYLGYVCGFNSQGTVKFTFNATGGTGYHIIDLYPGIYRGQKTTPDIYLAPQLTYKQDHPGSRIPAIHLSFEVK
ncbi:hypothetical protein [Paenibacillus protaetiae]|uniref:Uncharacterized protein n=1 Tax=Paenibacillus protaetiae TaxID=2509456 RepID=A0A4P6EXB0_9BACL|nr:hypothetical protein [Paenibacillus protaetiae]QAY66863.1 hypothetical protein ET464_11115 [Paenibacillus protaetiae]